MLARRELDGQARFVRRADLTKEESDQLASVDEARAHLQAAIGGYDRDGSGRAAAIEILSDCGLARVDLVPLAAPKLAQLVEGFLERGLIVMLAADPEEVSGGGDAPDDTEPELDAPVPRPLASRTRRVVSIKWDASERWCSEQTSASGTTANYSDGETIEVKFQQRDGNQSQSVEANVSGNRFSAPWTIKEILPVKKGDHLAPDLKMDASGGGQTSPDPLTIKFVTKFDKVTHVADRTHFELSLADNVVLISSDIKYVQGWAGQVVKLGNKAPAGAGGLLDGQLTWSGYRWMKNDGLGKKFWDGTTWRGLPAGFALADSNNFAVGFYKQGTSFVCQYGGTWPEPFTDWNIDAPDKQSTITTWINNIKTTWTGKFDLKRKECQSSEKKCCRYATQASVTFSKQATFAAGMMIIADGNIRSNDSLLFLGESRVAVAAHEFGHHLGNPDEYTGAAVDTTLNSDGAVNGIDPDSIMGQNLTKVKVRHYREIVKVFTGAVSNTFGKSYNYLVVPP